MIARRVLLFLFLLGIWGQAASACLEAHAASAAAQTAMEFTASAAPEDFVATGGDHRCECPATIQSAQALVSGSDKSLLPSYVAGAGVLLNPSNPNSVTLAQRGRASGFIARRSGRPPYLLVSRLRL